MKRMTLLIVTLLLVIDATAVLAQRRGQQPQPWYGAAPEHKVELYLLGGYVWTFSRSATYNLNTGEIDAKNSGFWGIAADITVRPEVQLELLFRRQDTKLQFRRAGTTEDVTDMSIEYYQIGAVSGVQKGNVKPFTVLTLGASRFAFDAFDDEWKFAVIFGLGAKFYLNEKIAIRAQANLPISITNGFVGVGTGGLSVGGTGITQIDVGLGLAILLGKN